MKSYSELIIDIQNAAKGLEKAQASADYQKMETHARQALKAAAGLLIVCEPNLTKNA